MARFSPSVADHCISQEQTADHHLQQPYIANNKVGERDYLAVVVVVEQRDPARRPPLWRQQRLASTNVNAESKSPGFDRQRKKSRAATCRLLATTRAHLEGIAPCPSPGWPLQPERTGSGWTRLPTDRSWRRRVRLCDQTWFLLLYLKITNTNVLGY
jgi:hypothetical protein